MIRYLNRYILAMLLGATIATVIGAPLCVYFTTLGCGRQFTNTLTWQPPAESCYGSTTDKTDE